MHRSNSLALSDMSRSVFSPLAIRCFELVQQEAQRFLHRCVELVVRYGVAALTVPLVVAEMALKGGMAAMVGLAGIALLAVVLCHPAQVHRLMNESHVAVSKAQMSCLGRETRATPPIRWRMSAGGFERLHLCSFRLTRHSAM